MELFHFDWNNKTIPTKITSMGVICQISLFFNNNTLMPDNRLVLSQLQKIMQHVILKIWKINGILYTEEFVISWFRAKASTEARPGLVWLVSYHYTNTIWTRRNIFLSQKYFIFAGGRQIKSDNQMLLKWTHSVFLTPWSYSNSVILEYTGQWTKSVIVRGISKTTKFYSRDSKQPPGCISLFTACWFSAFNFYPFWLDVLKLEKK